MRILYIAILVILITIITNPLTALASATATSQIDKTQIELNNYVVLTIKIDDASGIESPILMGMDNFQQMSVSSSNNTSIINGNISNSVLFQYILIPKKAGTFNIGEAFINTKEGRLHTKAELITITDNANTQSQTNQGLSNNNNQKNFNINNNVELRAEVNNNNPYKNEQIIYTIRLFFRGTLSDIQLNTPQFQDFIAEPLDERQQYTTYVQGRLYNVLEKAYALFPTKSGKLSIQPSSITCSLLTNIDPFDLFGNYNSRPVSLKTNTLNLIVKEPPKSPKNYEGSVGEFKIKTEINNTILDIGETAKLQISIWGKGNITNIQKPSFNFDEQFKKSFKIYDMNPITQITDKNDFITGQKVFKYDIVALEPGIFHIPPAEYAYFNPETKMYHQLRSSIIEIRVKPGKGIDINNNNQPQTNNSDVDEVISIYTDENCLINENISKKQYLLYLVMLAIPLLALIITLTITKYREKREANSHIIKKRQAFRNANNKLKKLKYFVKNDNSKEFFSQLDNIIKDYIGNKLYLPSGSLTSKDVEMHLLNRNVSKKTILFITEILKLCEMSEFYNGQKAHQKIAIAFKDAKKVLQLIEKELKK